MKQMTRLLAGASVLGLALAASGAQAAGTTDGTLITNNVSVGYSVGGVNQTAVTATNQFRVDRRVSMTVAEFGTAATTTVIPGQAAQVTTFSVTNTSNAPLDLGLTVTQPNGGPSPHSATNDGFDVTGVTMYVDSNNNNTYEPLVDTTVVTYLDELPADASRTVFVVANIPASATNGQVAVVNLAAKAFEPGVAGTQGAPISATAGANNTSLTVSDTVLFDAAGTATGDTANDGQNSAADDYTVASASLIITKTSRVVYDPVLGISANAKAIPGGTIEYCITVQNTGSAAATNVVVDDIIPAELTYPPQTSPVNTTSYTGGATVFVDGTSSCTGGTAGGGTYTPGNRKLLSNAMTVNAGTTRSFYFQANIK